MAYPALPFPNHTWRMSHHQGVLTAKLLNALLFAASTYQESRDPTQEINNYLIANDIVPPNIRGDSQQPAVWRDYQQLLPELGLIRSTRSARKIQINPVGLSFLDGGIGFTDLLTTQAFRWQYPNGQNMQRSPHDSSMENFSAQQALAGIRIKPAVLLWQVLDSLATGPQASRLTVSEVENFLIPAKSHDDVHLIVDAIMRSRSSGSSHLSGKKKQRRNASDWMKRFGQTHAFLFDEKRNLRLSDYSTQNADQLRILMKKLVEPEAFWTYPTDGSQAASWSLWYGTFTAEMYPIPHAQSGGDYGSEPEPEEGSDMQAKIIQIQPFDLQALERSSQDGMPTISSSYSSDLSDSAHRLHDSMVRLIADACHRKNALVFCDPATLDILVEFDDQELLIEVKSATAQNLNSKIRVALGQVIYYDYLRSKQTTKRRRKGIALTLGIQESHWSTDFFINYLDVDLITLRSGKLFTYSSSTQIAELIS